METLRGHSDEAFSLFFFLGGGDVSWVVSVKKVKFFFPPKKKNKVEEME